MTGWAALCHGNLQQRFNDTDKGAREERECQCGKHDKKENAIWTWVIDTELL